MKAEFFKVKESLIIASSAFIMCLIFGFLFFQSAIFDKHNFTFQFVINGAFGSVLFVLLKSFTLRFSLSVFVLILILAETLILKSVELSLILRDILFLLSLGAAIFIHWRFSFTIRKSEWRRPLILAALLAIGNIVATAILLIFSESPQEFDRANFINLSIGFLIGFGLGTGIEIGNIILNYQRPNDSEKV